MNPSDALDAVNSWFASIREVDWVPNHFITFPCRKEIFEERKEWIHNNTQGRYAWGTSYVVHTSLVESREVVGFEDPNDAALYALIHPN